MKLTISKHGSALTHVDSNLISHEQLLELLELGYSIHKKPSSSHLIELAALADMTLGKVQAGVNYNAPLSAPFNKFDSNI